jgi:hypothetical protein
MIQNEVITSHKKNVDIDWRWQDLEEKEDCEELAKVLSTIIDRYIGHRWTEGCMHLDHLTKRVTDQAVYGAA